MLIQGFIDNGSVFYFWVISPIMIAYENRATHLITPAATIITTNIVVSNLLDYIFTEILVLFVSRITHSDSIKRIFPIAALLISLSILWPEVRRERM